MENGGGETCEPKAVRQTQQLCRFFSQGRRCYFGAKCKYLHTRVESKSDQKDTITTPCTADVPPTPNMGLEGDRDVLPAKPKASSGAGRRACRYFLSGHCTMEDRCRFWHPPQVPSMGDHAEWTEQPGSRRAPLPRPNVLQVVKLSELTEDVAAQLRDTEIKQLKRRFPKNNLIIQERSDGKVTYYRATVEATDPDWPFDLKEIDIMVSFPDTYPQEIFTLDIPLDQELPQVMGRYVQQASLEWLQAKHATNQLLGKVELLFRPFLRWLDRSLEKLFTEGARQLKKDLELEKAGLQFIPYQDLQVTVCEKSDNHPSDTTSNAADEEEEAGDVARKSEGDIVKGEVLACGEEQQNDEDEDAAHLVENIKISDVRRGTEVRLLGLTLGENTATVVGLNITVCLQCNRCKVTADLTLNGKTTCIAHCEKCSARISAGFRPSMLHRYSDVLGYLDLQNAVPSDLVFQDCHLTVGCLNCSQESFVQNLCYGQTKEANCENCHGKLSVFAESARFQYIQPRSNKTGPCASIMNLKTVRDPAVQKGKPLPEKGACKHYKQSHRWLRFPCCGRAYPCDVCHDEDQDHPMELASRMICGYCAKEQPYSNGKPCITCGSMMTRGAHTCHWEGGLGCRNKIKMSRNDRQKYANTNKTISKKASEKN